MGKTTAINQFSEKFHQYIYLNLELPEDRQPFKQFTNLETLLQALFFLKNKILSAKDKTLLFIDEIQEVGEALRSLEKALLIHLLYPLTNAKLPMLPNLKKSPRLMVLDTGMLNYFAGIQKDILRTADLNTVYQGTMIEHLVGQELLATQSKVLSDLSFWVREKKTSMAEVDYVLPYDGKLIPIEVKSGAEGKLRSLHLYMDMAPHTTAIRFYAGQLSITEAVTPGGKAYHLLNLPYFLASQTKQYVSWFQKQHSAMNNS